MKNIFLSITFLLSVFFFQAECSAQTRMVNGMVFTFDSIPLINANIKVKSTKQTVKSDTSGRFSVSCAPTDVLTVSARGFYSEKVKLNKDSKIAIVNLKLKPGDKNREIAIGYGYVSDANKLNAVSTLRNNNKEDFSQYSSLFEVIKSRFPGVEIINNEIIIRGAKSLNASNAALIVLNGIPADASILSTIPPGDVKSINVIKDSGSAVYGSRGANGVVLIETKKGND